MIEVNIDERLKIKNLEDILSMPKTVLVNKFNEEASKDFREQFTDAVKTGQDVIPIVIDSYGGAVDSLLAMVDVIEESPVPVATIVSGKAMSCGSILLSCGTEGYRFMGPHARVLVHPITSFAWGNLDDLKVTTKENRRLVKLCFRMMAKNCGLDKNFFIDKMKEKRNADWLLTPKECKKLNLINHIGTPRFHINMEVDVLFGV